MQYMRGQVEPEKTLWTTVRLASREMWGAAKPKSTEPLPHLIEGAIVHYSTDTNPCHNHEQCCRTVREIQERHMAQGLPDIAYNFLIGGDGTVYEGRGWFTNPSKLLEKHGFLEGKSLDIAYIGRFSDDKPAYPDMPRAAVNLLNRAILMGFMDPTFRLVEDNGLPDEIPDDSYQPPKENDETVLDLKDEVPLDIIRRKHWEALPPTEKIPRLLHPVPYIRFIPPLSAEPCLSTKECMRRVQGIQKMHMDGGLPDIAFNFMIGGDGMLYEGRGWNFTPKKIESKLKKFDGPRLDIAYIGEFYKDCPGYIKVARAAVQLINFAMMSNFLKRPFTFIEGDDDKTEGPLKAYLNS